MLHHLNLLSCLDDDVGLYDDELFGFALEWLCNEEIGVLRLRSGLVPLRGEKEEEDEKRREGRGFQLR